MEKKINLVSALMVILVSVSAQCDSTMRQYRIAENNVTGNFTNAGNLFMFNDNIRSGGIEFPKGSGIISLFASTYWFSGIDAANTLKGAFERFPLEGSKDIYAGPISTNGTWRADCDFWAQAFRIDLDSINIFRNSGGTTLPLQVKEWPAKGNPFLIARGITIYEDAAPFIDMNSDGIYNPNRGDFPKVKGDVSFFSIENDDSVHTNSGALKMRIETKKMLYLCKANGILGNTLFYDLVITNKSTGDYSDCIFSVFADPDLGCYNDDYVGCDSNRNVAYVYNARPFDMSGCTTLGLGNDSILPIFGIKLLNSPKNTRLSSFLNIINGFSIGLNTDPYTVFDYRNYQLCKNKMGYNMTYNGVERKFAYSGNPSKSNEWSMCSDSIPGDDQRFVMNSYIGNLKKDSSISFSLAYFHVRPKGGVGLCPDRNVYINPYADSLQYLFDNNRLCQTFPLGIASFENSENGVSIYPNPTQGGSFTIATSNNATKEISLLNPIGQKVLTQQTTSPALEISTINLAVGIYVVKVKMSNTEISKKLVIN
jgi:hypothetical protein